jgi:secondary thiamine-phosphate synthase enzyme
MIHTASLSLETRGDADVHDITEALSDAVAASGLRAGVVTVFCQSSTSAVTTIEYEAGAVRDLQRLLDEIIPPGSVYAHNARWGDGNGHSHVRAAFLGPSLSIPFIDATLALGTWQQVIHLDFDVRPRHRELVVQVVGE